MRTIAERTCLHGAPRLTRLHGAPRLTRLLAVSLTVFAVTGSVHAEDVPYGVRANPLKLPEHLQNLGSPLPPPSEAGVAKTHTFFLNYDGAQVSSGGDDNSASNTSMFQEFAGNYVPYGGGAKRAASMQAVLTDWAPYDVVITDTRPNGVYTMCINTPTNPFGGGVLGIAPLDCNDSNGANIVFAFHSDNDQFPASTQATTMSQEIAHAFGLEHVNFPSDIMNPTNAGGDPKFLDQCLAIVPDPNFGILCVDQHAQFCGGSQQNSHQELLWLFGASTPDSEPPAVQITFPVNGQVYSVGEITNITANATDNQSVMSVDLLIDGVLQQTDNGAPFEWPVNGIPVGNYCFSATARDTSGNLGNSDPACITVEAETPDTSTSTTTTTSDTGDADTGSGSASMSGADESDATGDEPTTNGLPEPDPDGVGGSLPGLPPDYGQDDEGGCRVVPPLPAASLLVLTLVGLGRRRRR